MFKRLSWSAGGLFFGLLAAVVINLSAKPASAVAYTPPRLSIASAVSDKIVSNAKASWPWYIARASGIVAAILLLLLILSGVGQITGYTYKFLEPLPAWATHRALGIAFAASVCVHVTVLLFDKFVTFNVLQLLVPFVSPYKPVTIGSIHLRSLGVALGILGLYLTAIIIISTWLWMNKKPSLWKLLHYLAYLIVLLVFVHSIMVGTDLRSPILRTIWIIGGIVILISIAVRLWRAGTIGKGKP